MLNPSQTTYVLLLQKMNLLHYHSQILNSNQIVDEICYLRATTTPNIKQQRRVKLEDGSGRYKMERYPLHELRSFVRNAIKPECEIDSSVNNLLRDVFKQYS